MGGLGNLSEPSRSLQSVILDRKKKSQDFFSLISSQTATRLVTLCSTSIPTADKILAPNITLELAPLKFLKILKNI